MAWAQDYAGSHQRQSDENWLGLLNGIGRLAKDTAPNLDVGDAPLAALLEKVVGSQIGREADTYRCALDITGQTLMPIPQRFRGTF